MAKYNFRQGIARHQTDITGNPVFLARNGNYVKLLVSPDPTIGLIAQGETDYSFIENRTVDEAWGPFPQNTTVWLYWDIDFQTGELTRDFTTVDPVDQSNEPTNPLQDCHWFDTSPGHAGGMVMKVRKGSRWTTKLRLFAAEYTNGAVLHPQPMGSQVGVSNLDVYAGQILFDDEGKPLQKWKRNRTGHFITSETPLSGQFSRIANFRVESAINQAKSSEHIPIHYAVAYIDYNILALARRDVPEFPAIGISAEESYPEEVRSFITKGYVQNFNDWNWEEPAGTPIFVGLTGELVTEVPQEWSLQRIATVVDPHTIYVDTKQLIEYFG